MASKDFFIRQLQRLPASRRLEINNSVAKVCCPFHGGGKEHTPSMVINLENSVKYKAGSSFCFACSDKVLSWDEFAKHFKLSTLANNTDHDASISDKQRLALFGDPNQFEDFIEGSQIDPLIEFMPLWNPKEEWRSISGKLLNKLQARLIATEYGNRMYLPCYMNGIFYGGITCRLKKKEGAISYSNDEGTWVSNVVFPHDYTKALLAKQKRRVLFFGEGPRDALNPLQYDVPAAANLGGKTVWTKRKAQILIDLEPDLLVVATDPDEIGNETARLINKAVRGQFDIKRMKYPKLKNGEKSDPGNTTKERWLELKYKLGII